MNTSRLTIAGLATLAVILSLIVAVTPRSTVVYGDLHADLGDYTMTLSTFNDASGDHITIYDKYNGRLVNYVIIPTAASPRFEVLSIFDLSQAFGTAPAVTPTPRR